MKTNQVMMSNDRCLFDIIIRQETATSFLNLSDLQDSYDSVRFQKSWGERRIQHVMETEQFAERIYYVLIKRGNEARITLSKSVSSVKTIITAFAELTDSQALMNCTMQEFKDEVNDNGIVSTLKKYGSYRTTGRAANRTTWCDPYIWVLIGLEMNPEMYAKVMMWVTDTLILNRISAGNMYKDFTNAISKFIDVDYAKAATAINYIVFNKSYVGIRQKATASELKEVEKLETSMAGIINYGGVDTFQKAMDVMRKMYVDKHKTTPKPAAEIKNMVMQQLD